MGFEDDMIEDGFHDEQDYWDYLSEEADIRRERINETVRDYDDDYSKPRRFRDRNDEPPSELSLMLTHKNGDLVCRHENYCRWVLIDKTGKVLLNKNESARGGFFLGGEFYYRICIDDSSGSSFQGIMDSKGNRLLPTFFKRIEVKPDGLEVEYNNSDTFITPCIRFFSIEELLSIAKRPSGYLDWENDAWPEEIIPFVDGVRAIRRNGKWGFEKENGELLVDCKYTAVHFFREYYDHIEYCDKEQITPRTRVLAIVEDDNDSGCIDMSGNLVIHIHFGVWLSSTKEEDLSNKAYYLWGQHLCPDMYDKTIDEDIAVQVDGTMITPEGHIIPETYDWGRSSGVFINVRKDGYWGTIDQEGKVIIPCKYLYYEQLLSSGQC